MYDLNLVQEVQSKVTSRAPQAVPTIPSWIPPPNGYWKINVGASVAKNKVKGSVAAVCRDAGGSFTGASSLIIMGINDPCYVHWRRSHAVKL